MIKGHTIEEKGDLSDTTPGDNNDTQDTQASPRGDANLTKKELADSEEKSEGELIRLDKGVEYWRQRALHNKKLFQSASRLFYKALKIGGYTLGDSEYDRKKGMLSMEYIERAFKDMDRK